MSVVGGRSRGGRPLHVLQHVQRPADRLDNDGIPSGRDPQLWSLPFVEGREFLGARERLSADSGGGERHHASRSRSLPFP